jgi:hypothetical protein
LERYRYQAGDGYREWLSQQGPGLLGSAEARKRTLERLNQGSIGTSNDAKGTPGTPKRRPGQPLAPNEEKEYRRILSVAKRLKLTPRMPGNIAKIAAAAGTDREVVIKALRWGRKHNLI